MDEVFSQAALASKVSMAMKLAISMTLAAAVAFSASTAHAQETSAKRTTQSTQTHKTNDYVESQLGGDSVVTFTGDDLAAPPGGYYGDTIRRPPGVMRVGLIRPRMNFVMEMLKSVENL